MNICKALNIHGSLKKKKCPFPRGTNDHKGHLQKSCLNSHPQMRTGSQTDIPGSPQHLFVTAKKGNHLSAQQQTNMRRLEMWDVHTIENFSGMRKRETLPFVTTWRGP